MMAMCLGKFNFDKSNDWIFEGLGHATALSLISKVVIINDAAPADLTN